MNGKSMYHVQAEAAIRDRLHPKLFDALNPNDDDSPDLVGDIARVETVVIEVLNDPSTSWALAYIAGVVMAPGVFQAAQAQPAQPLDDGVG